MKTNRDLVARRERGVGYCTNARCPEHLQMHPRTFAPRDFHCAVCGELGGIELERGVRGGDGPLITDVRLEYCFDPGRAIYLERIFVRDEQILRPQGIFTLQTPLISDVESARSLASALLGQLSHAARRPRARARTSESELAAEGWSLAR